MNTHKDQIKLVQQVLNQHKKGDTKLVWYGSYAVIACTSKALAWTIRAQLKRVGNWEYELKPGRINKDYHYLKVIFHS